MLAHSGASLLLCLQSQTSNESPYKTHTTTEASFVLRAKMKQFSLSEDRIVTVKKAQGQYSVIVKQKDSDVKFAAFTPNR